MAVSAKLIVSTVDCCIDILSEVKLTYDVWLTLKDPLLCTAVK